MPTAYKVCKIFGSNQTKLFHVELFDGVDGLPQRHQSAKAWSLERHKEGRPCMKKFIRIGVDLAKNYFQIHALTSADGEPRTRKLSRQGMRKFFAEIEPCVVGMEACASSHYWARELLAMAHNVRLIPPIYVKPYVKCGKNDAADAEAICEGQLRS